MAHQRRIIARTKLFYQQQQQQPQRFTPSISHISCSSDREELPAKTFSRNSEHPSRFRRYNAANSLLLSGNISRIMQSKIPAGYRLGFHRNLSIKVIDGGDLIGDVGDKAAAAVVNEVAVAAANSSAPVAAVVNEVAVAAADSSALVAAFQYLIDYVHCYTGFQWWESIAATAVLIHFIQLPFLIERIKLLKRCRDLSDSLQTELNELKLRNEPTDSKRKEVNSLCIDFLKKLFRVNILPLIATGISFFAISNMTVKVPSFVTGGTLWFMDLTTPDHSLRLPILLTLTLWLRFKFNPNRLLQNKELTGKDKSSHAVAALLYAAVPVTAGLPSAIYCYWIASNLFTVASAIVLTDPLVVKLLGISTKPPSTDK